LAGPVFLSFRDLKSAGNALVRVRFYGTPEKVVYGKISFFRIFDFAKHDFCFIFYKTGD
jgi:hypothetical protein